MRLCKRVGLSSPPIVGATQYRDFHEGDIATQGPDVNRPHTWIWEHADLELWALVASLEPEEELEATGLQEVEGVEANCRGESQGRRETLSSATLASVGL